MLIAPQWIEELSWPDTTVSVDLTRQAVTDAPTYDPGAQLDRQQEQAMHEQYGRPGLLDRQIHRDTKTLSTK